jgi:hypothetical protein
MIFSPSRYPATDGDVATTPRLDGECSVLVSGAGNDLVIGRPGGNLMAGGFGLDRFADHRAESSDAGSDLDALVSDPGPGQ